VREGVVYGPPALKGTARKADNHNGFVEKGFFEEAEFCKACHQLDRGYMLNGKVLVNTYREWTESVYGEKNIACQQCHMPGGRHLFRGIHDPEMVKMGIKVEVEEDNTDDGLKARLKITNIGVGHYFPTYVTPLVVVKGFLADGSGNMADGTLKEAFIGRKVSQDLSREFFDTRIPPLESFEFDYEAAKSSGAEKLVLEIWVYPDEFYNIFFSNVLKGLYDPMNNEEIKKALEATELSRYLLIKRELNL
jgi:hypothetical protein